MLYHGSLHYLSRLQLFSLCRCLLITTHLAWHAVPICVALALAQAPVRRYLRAVYLKARCCPNRGLREVGGCLAACWDSRRKALSYSHAAPQAKRSTLQSVAAKRVRASVSRLPFPDPPSKSLSLSAWLVFARSARLPGTDTATAETSIPTIS